MSPKRNNKAAVVQQHSKTPEEAQAQIKRLDEKLGEGQGAARERDRLARIIERGLATSTVPVK